MIYVREGKGREYERGGEEGIPTVPGYYRSCITLTDYYYWYGRAPAAGERAGREGRGEMRAGQEEGGWRGEGVKTTAAEERRRAPSGLFAGFHSPASLRPLSGLLRPPPRRRVCAGLHRPPISCFLPSRAAPSSHRPAVVPFLFLYFPPSIASPRPVASPAITRGS